MLRKSSYIRIMRASAFYDLVVTAPFATPWTLGLLASQLLAIHEGLGLSGVLPSQDPVQVLFANLMGSVVIVWSIVRLHLGLAVLGRYDGVARILFSTWMIHALNSGLSLVILPILVIEIGFGIVQFLPHDDGDDISEASADAEGA